jgi:MFS family permease
MSADTEQTPLLAATSIGIPSSENLVRTVSRDSAVKHGEDGHEYRNNIVAFSESDPDDPQSWATRYKWAIVSLLAFQAFTVTFTCIGVVPVAARIVTDLSPSHTADPSSAVLLVTIWELGEAVGPFLIGPLSEHYGRYSVSNTANVLFILATLLAALSPSVNAFIAARFLTGLSVASNVLNPSIVADILAPEFRGKAMSSIMLAPLIGGAIGPAIAGSVTETLGWRAIIWGSVLLMSVAELAFLFTFRETYSVVILKRRAVRLRTETGNLKLRTIYDCNTEANDKAAHSAWRDLGTSIARPVTLFFTSPILIATSLYASTTFTFFYIMSTTLPEILETFYSLSPAQVGSSLMVFSIGSTSGVLLCNFALDRVYVSLRDRDRRAAANDAGRRTSSTSLHDQPTATTDISKIEGKPEYRLPLVLLGAAILPICVALYGLLLEPPLHQILPFLSKLSYPAPLAAYLTLQLFHGFALLLAFLPLLSYVVESTGEHSASAMTAVIVVRCLFGTFAPLGVRPLVRQLGWGGGFGVLGIACAVMGGVPAGLWILGERWRRWTLKGR